jgi:hypothetical protein
MLGVAEENNENLSQNNVPLGRNLYPRPPVYEVVNRTQQSLFVALLGHYICIY